MKGTLLTEGVIPALPEGEYAVFENGILWDLFAWNGGESYPIIDTIGTDENIYEEQYLKRLSKDKEYIVINKELVKL